MSVDDFDNQAPRRGNHFGPRRDVSTPRAQNTGNMRGDSRSGNVAADDTSAFMHVAQQRLPRQTDAQQTRAYGDDQGFDSPYSVGRPTFNPTSYTKDSKKLKKKKRGKVVAAVIIALLFVVLVGAGVSGFLLLQDARGVFADAREITSSASVMMDDFKEGDGEGLKNTAADVAAKIAGMKETTSGPLWTAASFVPVLGEDVQLARTMLDQADNLAQNALLPAAESLSAFSLSDLMQDGSVNLELLTSVISTLQEIEPVVTESAAVIDDLPDAHIDKIQEALDKVKEPISAAAAVVQQVNEISPVLPQILGANGARNYLITAENNAEIRTDGGFVGALGIMTVDNGHIALQEFEGTLRLTETGPTDQIVISDEEMTLFQPYEPTMNFISGDAYFTPDFPRGAEIVSTLWRLKHDGQQVDGVIALDPIFLQYLLQLVGGVTAVDGMAVDGTNAAEALLSTVYWNYPEDGTMQDAIFASVASAAFDKLVSSLGDVELTGLISVLQRGASEGRLLMWMVNDDEEAALGRMGVDGALPTDPTKPEAGIYVNNYSYSKLDWYLDIDASVSEGTRNTDGTSTYQVKASFTNTLDPSLADSLPSYVQAHNGGADSPAQEMLRLYLYAPAGGSITNVNCSYGEMWETTHNGLQVFFNDIRMQPGETVTVTYSVTVPAEVEGDLKLRVTPTAQYARMGTTGDATKLGSVQGERAATE